MIDHILGRPSTTARKYQVILVALVWSLYLSSGDRNGPKPLRRLSSILSRKLSAWQTVVITFITIYLSRNFDALAGLESPEPLANLYTPSFFRATWVATALDAGYWSAMRIRYRPAREVLSLIFSLYYLIAADRADEKVRQIRSALTVEHLRVSWNKGATGILGALSAFHRPRLTTYPPRALQIPRPAGSQYDTPIKAWVYFDGPLTSLFSQTRVVLDVPGGGFVAMSPRHYDDKLLSWAGRLGIPVISIDYGKAPEYPYPYALHECFDAYRSIIDTKGASVGLSGDVEPRIIVTGDSAGGNLAVGMVLMLVRMAVGPHESETSTSAQPRGFTVTGIPAGLPAVPLPDGVMLVYPSLNVNIANWMSEEQMALIIDRRSRQINKRVLRQKSDDYRRIAVTKSATVDDNIVSESDGIMSAAIESKGTLNVATAKPVRLATSSVISYFNDRILTAEMMRSMILLYIGPPEAGKAPPSFRTDYLLSPVLAPDFLLEHFPPLKILTGERDPLVDDTVIFAGKVRAARRARLQREVDAKSPIWPRDRARLDRMDALEERQVQVSLIPGISHGFLNLVPMFPDGWKYINRCSQWIDDLFHSRDLQILSVQSQLHMDVLSPSSGYLPEHRSHLGRIRKIAGQDSRISTMNNSDAEHGDEEDDEKPLEMAPLAKRLGVRPRGMSSARSSKDTIATSVSSTGGNRNNSSSTVTSDNSTEHHPLVPKLQIPLTNGNLASNTSAVTGGLHHTQNKKIMLESSVPAVNRSPFGDSTTAKGELNQRDPLLGGTLARLNRQNVAAAGLSLSRRQKGKRPVLDRNMSISSLPSQEDLLERRMEGLIVPLGVGAGGFGLARGEYIAHSTTEGTKGEKEDNGNS